LLSTSPCIDSGSNTALPAGITTDLDGNSRIVNGVVDMGAYECQGTPTVVSVEDKEVIYLDEVSLQATLTTDVGAPLENELLTFKINNTIVGTATTDQAGVAYQGNEDKLLLSSEGTATLRVSKAATQIVVDSLELSYGQVGVLSTTLTTEFGKPHKNATVTFTINGFFNFYFDR